MPGRAQFVKKVKRWIKWLVLLTLLLLLTPFLVSRWQASGNRIRLLNDEPATPIANANSFRIACYNIAHGRGLADTNWSGGDPQTRIARLDEIAALLSEIDADIVVLNEVDFDASWSNNVNQAQYLADKCGYPHRVEQRNLDFRVLYRTWRFGNAVLSKLPLSNAALIDLPSYSPWETAVAGKKRAFGVDAQISEGRSVHVIAAHLSHRSEDLRERSADSIIQHVRNQRLPCLIAGDMNSSPVNFPRPNVTPDARNAMETFAKSQLFHRSQITPPTARSHFTFRSDNPDIVIDWFLVTEELYFKSYDVIDSQLSDHRPIVADIAGGND